MLTAEERMKYMNKLQKKHPNSYRQLSYHGSDRYSVQFFDKMTDNLIADYDIPTSPTPSRKILMAIHALGKDR